MSTRKKTTDQPQEPAGCELSASAGSAFCEQADGKSKRGNGYHHYLKKRKARLERRKAKREPEAPPTYGKYRGWET